MRHIGAVRQVLVMALLAILAGCAPRSEVPSAGRDAGRSDSGAAARAETADTPRQADKVVVLKGARRLLLMDEGEAFHSFRIALGREPNGPKRQEGDGRTPEGRYVLDWRNPDSRFYRSIHVSYPGPADLARAREVDVDPGDNIMIHGLPDDLAWLGGNHAVKDWTEGCIAVSNDEMDVIWNSVPPSTPIEIRP